MTLAISHTFQPKQVIRSGQVNTNNQEIVNYVNDLESSVSDGSAIADGSITEGKIADNAVTTAKLSDDCVTAVELRDDPTTDANRAVTTNHIRDSAVTESKIAASVAGSGLAGGDGSALSVNVDNSTIEINSDSLRLKDGGTTEAKLASGVVNKLGQNIGLVSRVTAASTSATYSDVLNYTGQGRLNGVCIEHSNALARLKLIIDGTDYGDVLITSTADHVEQNDGTSTTMFKMVSGTGQLNELNIFFRTSLQIQHRRDGGAATVNTYVQYERQQ